MKKKMLTQTLSPGFRLPKSGSSLVPDETSVTDGMELFRSAVKRTKTGTKQAPHGAFVVMEPGKWDKFQRHRLEMHMSSVVPANE